MRVSKRHWSVKISQERHLDRGSTLSHWQSRVLRAKHDIVAQQTLMLSLADVVVLSASGFGVTAAEAGRVSHTYLGPHGCLDVDVSAA
eukprot:895638-Amphidinium_carterae.1